MADQWFICLTMAKQALALIALTILVGGLFTSVWSATKEETLKDAVNTQTELHKTIERLTVKGYKALTDHLIEIDHTITNVIEQLTLQTDPHNITVLEMEFLRSKTRLFYEQIAIDSDVMQAENLSRRAEVLLEQTKIDIKALEAQNMSEQAEVLRIDVQQLELFSAILKNETGREPLRYIETLLSNVERTIERKLNSIEQELKRVKTTSKPHESYYVAQSFTEALNVVIKNLRAEGKKKLADEIQELSFYIIGLEKIKASGVYKNTETEKTLDNNIRENKNKLMAIINQLLKYY